MNRLAIGFGIVFGIFMMLSGGAMAQDSAENLHPMPIEEMVGDADVLEYRGICDPTEDIWDCGCEGFGPYIAYECNEAQFSDIDDFDANLDVGVEDGWITENYFAFNDPTEGYRNWPELDQVSNRSGRIHIDARQASGLGLVVPPRIGDYWDDKWEFREALLSVLGIDEDLYNTSKSPEILQTGDIYYARETSDGVELSSHNGEFLLTVMAGLDGNAELNDRVRVLYDGDVIELNTSYEILTFALRFGFGGGYDGLGNPFKHASCVDSRMMESNLRAMFRDYSEIYFLDYEESDEKIRSVSSIHYFHVPYHTEEVTDVNAVIYDLATFYGDPMEHAIVAECPGRPGDSCLRSSNLEVDMETGKIRRIFRDRGDFYDAERWVLDQDNYNEGEGSYAETEFGPTTMLRTSHLIARLTSNYERWGWSFMPQAQDIWKVRNIDYAEPDEGIFENYTQTIGTPNSLTGN